MKEIDPDKYRLSRQDSCSSNESGISQRLRENKKILRLLEQVDLSALSITELLEYDDQIEALIEGSEAQLSPTNSTGEKTSKSNK